MSCKSVYMFIIAMTVAMSAGAAKENVIRIQNNLRFGYDDNVYLNAAEEDSVEIIEVLNISGKANFSSRSDAVYSYQPEVRYRPDVDPEFSTYHDAYLKLNHAFSQRVFLTVSDRLRYQQRDAQTGVVNATDQNYLENDLMGSLDITAGKVSSVMLGAGYKFRIWDDDNYGEVRGNNFDKYDTSLSYFHELGKDTTKGMLGVDYTVVDYDGTRGGADAITLMTGADTIFNPNLNGFGRIGASMSSVDTATGSEDQTTPYLDAGIEYNPSERTSLNGNIGYSIYQSDNSLYNAQDRASFGLGFRHDITAKINVAGTLSYIISQYDGTLRTALGPVGIDADDDWMQFNIRGSYQINRNNFAEIGYSYTDRSVSSSAGGLTEYSRNRFDVGWRLRL